jgi:hypothetical protein
MCSCNGDRMAVPSTCKQEIEIYAESCISTFLWERRRRSQCRIFFDSEMPFRGIKYSYSKNCSALGKRQAVPGTELSTAAAMPELFCCCRLFDYGNWRRFDVA